MFCPNCGKELKPDAKFCFNCGFALESVKKNTVQLPPDQEIASASTDNEVHSETEQTMNNPESVKAGNHRKSIIIIAVIAAAAICFVLVMKNFSSSFNIPGFNNGDSGLISKSEKPHNRHELEVSVSEEESAQEEEKTDNSPDKKSDDSMDETKNQADSQTDKPTVNDGIHSYEVITADKTWEEAFQDCIARGGYLACIDSQKEWDTIISQIQSTGTEACYFYIAGTRNEGSSSYYWMNKKGELYGESLNSNAFWGNNLWLENEPSYQDGDITEDVMAILYMKSSNRWVLNDVANNPLEAESYLSGKIAYICEFE